VLKLSEPTKSRFPGFRDVSLVIHALKFSDVVAKMQRALAANHQGVQEFVAHPSEEH
jgi:hypothetical protein